MILTITVAVKKKKRNIWLFIYSASFADDAVTKRVSR